MTKLLTVEEAFVARGKGVLLLPRFTAEGPQPAKLNVRLVLPDGSTRETIATVEVAHMRGALAPYAMYRLPELTPEDVPANTEVWLVGSSA